MSDPNADAHPSFRTPDVWRAARRLQRALVPTPLVRSPHRSAWLKLENLQVTGAYKVRGAFNAIAAGVEAGDRRAVIAASAGNHGKAVAWAARHFGLRATVVAPRAAPRTKVDGARALGARVLLEGEGFDEALAAALALAEREGARFVHPFDDSDVVAGQGTVGLELAEYEPDVVVVPIGGGGLAAGIGLALRETGRRVHLVGAQVAGVDAMRRVLAGDSPGSPPAPTLADGLSVRTPGWLTRRLCAELLDEIVVVSEDEVRAALLDLALTDKIIAEGAGAVAVAALRSLPERGRRVAIVSGGNIDRSALGRLWAA